MLHSKAPSFAGCHAASPGVFFKRPSRKMLIGMTLLEITFVLLVMVAIIGGALVMASSTMNQSNTVQETQTVTNLAGSVRKTKTRNGFPADAAIGVAMDAMGIIPANVVFTAGGTAFKNSWGGDITFHQQDTGGNFAISYTNIPKQECISLVMSVKPGLLMSVGTGSATAASSGALMNIADLTAADGATICPSSLSTIHWSSGFL